MSVLTIVALVLGALGLLVGGFALQEYDGLFAGAVLVALLAITVEALIGRLERAAAPPGIRSREAAL